MTGGLHPAALRANLAEAEQALAQFASGPARAAADDIADAFERTGKRIATTLGRAGSDGEATMKRLAKIVLEELAKIALGQIGKSGGLPFFGARAMGGSVTGGGAYVVGERGPELFTPHGAGAVGAIGGAVNVHFHLAAGSDAQSVLRHQGQIAAQIARAVSYGRRNL